MRRSIVFSFVILLPLAAVAAERPECERGLQVLFYYPDGAVDQAIYEGFTDELAKELASPLSEIGYCLFRPDDIEQYKADTGLGENLVLHTAIRAEEGKRLLLVAPVRLALLMRNNLEVALGHPLAEVDFEGADQQTFLTVVVKKIVENLRTSYVCHLRIESEPESVAVATSSGLEGATPVEWVVPLGSVGLTATRKDYVSFEKHIELDAPGYHRLYVELRKRRFYHSRFMYPAAAFLVAAGGFYLAERYYYDKYQSLGEQDYYSRPDEFGERFHTAKAFERLAGASLGLAGVSFVLSFWF